MQYYALRVCCKHMLQLQVLKGERLVSFSNCKLLYVHYFV